MTDTASPSTLPEVSRPEVSRPDLVPFDQLVHLLPQAEKISFWQELVPGLAITDDPFTALRSDAAQAPAEADEWTEQLGVEGYFQTGPVLDDKHRSDMLRAIKAVRSAGFPAPFALVYDVFYRCFEGIDPILRKVLGDGYRFLPNSWIYYLEPSENDYGYEPHRDSEYPDTIREDGLPKVLNAWMALTEAMPINGCMYMLPAHRDPDYRQILQWSREGDPRYKDDAPPQNLDFQNLRALPAAAGSVTMWNQHVFHWGGRSSRHAPGPRVSMATYFQRGDIAPVDPSVVDVSRPLPFPLRLGIICRAILRYTDDGTKHRQNAEHPVVAFARPYIEALETQSS